MTGAADRILALAEDERGDGECDGPEHEQWRAEMRELVAKEIMAAVAPFQAIIDAHDLCHDLHGKVGVKEFATGCAAEQRRIYGSAPHADALAALARAVGNFLDHPGCNNPARATAMRKLRWAMEQAEAVG